MHKTRYTPLLIATEFFVNLSVNGLSLLELPPDMLIPYMHAWDSYIARISERAASNEEVGRLASLARLRRGFGTLIQGSTVAAIVDADWVIAQRSEQREVQTAFAAEAKGDTFKQIDGLSEREREILIGAMNGLTPTSRNAEKREDTDPEQSPRAGGTHRLFVFDSDPLFSDSKDSH